MTLKLRSAPTTRNLSLKSSSPWTTSTTSRKWFKKRGTSSRLRNKNSSKTKTNGTRKRSKSNPLTPTEKFWSSMLLEFHKVFKSLKTSSVQYLGASWKECFRESTSWKSKMGRYSLIETLKYSHWLLIIWGMIELSSTLRTKSKKIYSNLSWNTGNSIDQKTLFCKYFNIC